jgi:hypothetical protein
MPSLLDQAIAAHGGMKLWRELSRLRVRFSAGGLLFVSKWKRHALHDIDGLIDLSRPPTAVLSPYPGPGQRGVFEPDRVWVESENGTILKERRNPRESFRGLRRVLWWDRLDVLYFAGYALWNYLCAPFIFAEPGFVAEEIEPWDEENERWRRLRVTFPPTVPTHCQEQVFYFDARTLLRRLDYTPEVVGAWARAAHYCFDHKVFAGLMVPTRRRVVPRRPDDRARVGPTLVWIEVKDVVPE